MWKSVKNYNWDTDSWMGIAENRDEVYLMSAFVSAEGGWPNTAYNNVWHSL